MEFLIAVLCIVSFVGALYCICNDNETEEEYEIRRALREEERIRNKQG